MESFYFLYPFRAFLPFKSKTKLFSKEDSRKMCFFMSNRSKLVKKPLFTMILILMSPDNMHTDLPKLLKMGLDMNALSALFTYHFEYILEITKTC